MLLTLAFALAMGVLSFAASVTEPSMQRDASGVIVVADGY
jgi:hypothetical protein